MTEVNLPVPVAIDGPLFGETLTVKEPTLTLAGDAECASIHSAVSV